MSKALRYHIEQDTTTPPPNKRVYPIFSEELHPITLVRVFRCTNFQYSQKEAINLHDMPTDTTIHAFLMKIFTAEKVFARNLLFLTYNSLTQKLLLCVWYVNVCASVTL